MKILLAIDGSRSSQSVVKAVATRPWPLGSELRVISVADPFVNAELAAFLVDATSAARTLVESAANQLRATAFTVSPAVIQGHPGTSIVAEATNFGADFVFVGSHGNSPITRFLVGSTALAVIRNAPCSVEIVRSGANDRKHQKPIRILFATDGSTCSDVAAKSLAERPWPEKSQVRVVCVRELSSAMVGNEAPSAEVSQTLRETQLAEVNESLAAAAKILQKSHLETQSLVPKDINSPKTVILDEAEYWHADLIVVGSHGRRGLDRLLLGSVSEAVATYAHCSVEVIRSRTVRFRASANVK